MTTAPSARKRMSAGDRREQILDITRAIVAAEGFHAATPNRIADAAGITRPVLYQQFGDLAGLFVALIDREGERAAQQFAEAIPEVTDAAAGPFGSVFAGLLQAIDQHPETWRLFLFPPEGAPPELHQRLAQSVAVVREFLRARLLEAYPDLPDPELTALILHAAGRELLQLRLTDPARASTERILALIQHLRANILAPERPAR